MTKNPSNSTFWSTGNGKDFLKWAGISENEIPKTSIPEMFSEYDVAVDELVKKWLSNGDFKKIMQSLHGTSSNVELPEDYLALKTNFPRFRNESIPSNKTEALHFFYFWTQYQFSPDEDSLKLTDSLLHENTSINLLKLDLVKRNMGYIHKSIANYLLDDEIKTLLEIPTVPLNKIVPNALRLKNEISTSRENQIKTGNTEQQSVLQDYKNHIPSH